jgi:tetratricopeptide (TPR) repeat protein
MKNYMTFLFVMLFSSAFANDGRYIDAMKKSIQSVYAAQSIDELQQSANTFERIATAEKTRWEPHYYAAFAYIMMANRENNGAKKDGYLDQSMAAIEKAKAIAPAESEIIALEGFVYMIRVTVDPGSRGPEFAGLAMQTYGKAININPENPRALVLMAQMQHGTAKFFGSSTVEACGTLTKALEKFESFKSENPLAPQWGKGMAEGMKEQCK